MRRKVLHVFLAMLLLFSLAGCGSKADETERETEQTEDLSNTADEKTEQEQEQTDGSADHAEETPDSSPDVPGQDPAEKPADKPVEKPADQPEQKPAEPDKPAEKPSSSSVDLAAFYETVASSGKLPAMVQLEGDTLDALYPGLSAVSTKQCMVYTAMISAAVGEIALVEVQDSADVQAVQDIFQARIDYQVGDEQNPGGAWYPASIEGWKNGSRIVTKGNYLLLIALNEGADDIADSFKALFP